MPAPSQPTTLQELIDLLAENIRTGGDGLRYIDLSGDLFAVAGTFVGYLARSVLRIRQKEGEVFFSPEQDRVVLYGTAEVFEIVVYDVTWIGRVVDQVPRLSMSAIPADLDGWTFGANFPGLPEYLAAGSEALTSQPSFFYSLVFDLDHPAGPPRFEVSTIDAGVAGRPGITFTGRLNITEGDLAPVGDYFTEASALQLGGSIEMRVGRYALINLRAAVSGLEPPRLAKLYLLLRTIPDLDATFETGSLVSLAGDVQVLDEPVTVEVPLLQGDFVWPFRASFRPGTVTLRNGLAQLVDFTGGNQLPLPAGLDPLGQISLTEVVVGITPPAASGELPTLAMLGVTVAMEGSWNLPVPGVSVANLSAQWTFLDPLADRELIGIVSGTIFLGAKPDSPRVDVGMRLSFSPADEPPAAEISAELDTEYPVRIGQVFRHFTNGTVDLDLDVTQLDLLCVPAQRTLFIYCVLEGRWPAPVPLLEFHQLNFYIDYAPNGMSGSVTAAVTIADTGFAVTAATPGAGQGWRFSGAMLPAVKGITLDRFLDALSSGRWPQLPANLGAIELRGLSFFFDTQTEDVAFNGRLGWPFRFESLGLD
ncbi:MAG: hypothetical protein ACRDRO_19120, partial [Pseudonocardiaceae bacterium]